MKTRAHLKFIALFLVVTSAACQSKINEKQVESVAQAIPTDEKIKIQKEFEDSVARVQHNIEKLQQLKEVTLSAIQKTMGNAVSNIDLANLISKEIAEKIPKRINGYQVYQGKISIESSLLSKECKEFGYRIEAVSASPIKTVAYKLSSCNSVVPLEVMTAKLEKNRVEFKFNEENLMELAPELIASPLLANCEIGTDSEQPTICTNIVLAHTNTYLLTFDLKAQDETEIKIRARNKSTGFVQFEKVIKFSRSGAVEVLSTVGAISNETFL
jgi:hypothetical protein